MKRETVSILGCGWFGFPLAQALLADNYVVKGSTTNAEKLEQLKEAGIDAHQIAFKEGTEIWDDDFFKCDILVICIPPKAKEKTNIEYAERILRFGQLTKSRQVILISSTGVYEDGNFVVDEKAIPQPQSESGKQLLEAEMILRKQTHFVTTVIRFGGLVGPNRTLAKHFAGKKNIPNGLAPINLIHLNDCIGITKSIIRKMAFGFIYHGVAPSHPSRQEYYTKVCLEEGLESPVFLEEKVCWKQIESVNVPLMLKYKYKVLF